MQKTKLIIALAAVAALTLAAVGLAAAQIAQNQTFTGTEAPQNGAVPNQGFWGWIATVNGYVDTQTAQMFAGLTRMLAVFLAFILTAEAAIVIYVHSKINTFAEETLKALQ